MLAGAAETPGATIAFWKSLHQVERHLRHGNNDELRDSFHRIQCEGACATIPKGHQDLPLIVRVDQADKISKHDSVLVAQPGSRQNEGREAGVSQMNGYARWNQFGLTGLQYYWCTDTSPLVNSCRTGCSICGRLLAQTRVQDPDVDVAHLVTCQTGTVVLRGR